MKKLLILSVLVLTNSVLAKDRLIEKDFKKKVFKHPTRELSIIVGEDGFYPSKIMAFQGEKLHFFITSTSKKNDCFVLQKHEVFVSAEKGVINEAEVIVDNPGRFRFYCPASKFEGHLTVFERFTQEEEVERSVASEKPKYWTPRDYDE